MTLDEYKKTPHSWGFLFVGGWVDLYKQIRMQNENIVKTCIGFIPSGNMDKCPGNYYSLWCSH